jgi:DNA-binding transcriptional LysR family regulator
MTRSSLQIAHLITFRSVAREASFTRAALALNVTQPAVTQQIRALQRHFNVTLVDVVGRRVRLTEAGAFLLERVDHFLDRLDALEREMREYSEVERGELRLGATMTIGSYGLAPLIARFRARYPNIGLSVTVENTQRIAERVVRGELSLALVEGPLSDPRLEIIPYQQDRLDLVVPPNHRLAQRRRPIRAVELAGETFITREEGSGTRELFQLEFRKAGVEPRIGLSLPTGEGIVQAVEEGLGIAVISTLFTRNAVREGRLAAVPLADVDLRRTFRLVMLKSVTPSPASLAFAALAQSSTTNG